MLYAKAPDCLYRRTTTRRRDNYLGGNKITLMLSSYANEIRLHLLFQTLVQAITIFIKVQFISLQAKKYKLFMV